MTLFSFKKALSAVLCASLASALYATVELAPVFSDNAVLQRDRDVPVWGWADPGEAVTVKFADQTRTATAAADGAWSVKLAPMPASKEGRALEAYGAQNTVSAQNILVGEVWIASGQSNMEMPLWGTNPRFRHRNANGTGKEVADATNLPLVRFTHMPKRINGAPQPKEPVQWHVAVAGEALESASAAGFFFARELQRELDIPIGIIGAYWGGTRVEPWTPAEGFDSVPEVASIAHAVNAKIPGKKEYRETSAKVMEDFGKWLDAYKAAVADGKPVPVAPKFPDAQVPYTDRQCPTVLYNGMLSGYAPYAVRGAIWYQGEANLAEGMLYRHKMQALLNGWRTTFQNPDLKFYFAQLAPYYYGRDALALLPKLWEAQQAFVDANADTTGMVVLTDAVHDIRDIHPADKEVVGKRLARLALNRDYGRSDIKADSPRLKTSRVEGNRFLLDFNFVESWQNADGNAVPYFELAGVDGIFKPAKAEIVGTQIAVSSDAVAAPKSVRYMWHETDEGKLANEAGLVLGSFRVEHVPTFEELLAHFQSQGRLVYVYDLKSGTGFGDKTQVRYETDNSAQIEKPFSRVTYLMCLQDNAGKVSYACVSMDAFTPDVKKIGVPCVASGAFFQTRVRNLEIVSNVESVVKGAVKEGNIEFWPCNYGMANQANIPNANSRTYDFGDQANGKDVGYGSMQVHNFGARQTIFAYNNFAAGAGSDIGIGNAPAENTDWTFSRSGRRLTKAFLYVFVK